jgi:predicted XRE-type DNA-binding protein
VPATFDPNTDCDPFTDARGPGDGTLPAWSTRLLGLPPKHVITVKGNIEHMILMNARPVQAEIARLLGLPRKTVKHMRRRQMPAASRTELDNFVARVRAAIEREESPERRAEIRSVLRQYGPDQLQALLGRAYLDALKSPSQKTGSPAGETPRARVKRTGEEPVS